MCVSVCVLSSQSAKKFAIPGNNLNAQRAELNAHQCVCVCVSMSLCACLCIRMSVCVCDCSSAMSHISVTN